MTASVLRESAPGEVAHSVISKQLVTQPNLLAWAAYMTDVSAPTAAKMTEQTGKWGVTMAKNQTAYNIAFDTDLSFFDHMAQSPERSKQFAGYMKSVTSSPGVNMQHLLNGFDWQALGAATIVDVSMPMFGQAIAHMACYRWASRRAMRVLH
jgi:6-hydroxytryprostatin B O-methyltransferase